jgi:biopolymer transport protein ExbD
LVLSVVLTADGKTLVDGTEVGGDDAVLPLAKAVSEKNADVRAVIKADSAVPHGRVVHVLDLLKQAQLKKISFGVAPIDRGP